MVVMHVEAYVCKYICLYFGHESVKCLEIIVSSVAMEVIFYNLINFIVFKLI
jgi:hypothetical protein